MNLRKMILQLLESGLPVRATLIRRPNNPWEQSELDELSKGLETIVGGHPQYPDYAVAVGHHPRERISTLMGEKFAIIVTETTNIMELPFFPQIRDVEIGEDRHRHKCPVCSTIWEHTFAEVLASPIDLHVCPECGAEQHRRLFE